MIVAGDSSVKFASKTQRSAGPEIDLQEPELAQVPNVGLNLRKISVNSLSLCVDYVS